MDATFLSAKKLDIGGEALQGFQEGAKQTNVESNTLSTSIFRLSRALGEAKEGSEASLKAFAQLGISKKELSSMNTEQMVYRFSDALKDETDSSIRASAGQALLGRGASEAMGFWMQGSQILHGYSDELKSLGALMTDTELRTAHLAEISEKKLSTSWQGLKNRLAIDLIPLLIGGENAISGFINVAEIPINSKPWTIYSNAVDKAEIAVAYGITRVSKGMYMMADLIPGIDLSGTLKKSDSYLASLVATWKQLNGEIEKTATTAKAPEKQLPKFMTAEVDPKLNEKMDDSLTKAHEKIAEEGKKIFTEMQTPGEKYAATVANLKDLLKDGAINQETMNRAMKDAAKTFKEGTANKDFEALQKEAESITKKAMGPAEIFQEQKTKLDDLLSKGLISLKTYNDECSKDSEKLNKELQSQYDESPVGKAAKQMQDDAKSMFEETRTPAEKAMEKLSKINDLKSSGMIDEITYQREIAQLQEDSLGKETDKKDLMAEQVDRLSAQADLLKKMYGGEGGSTTGSQGSIGIQSMSMHNPLGGGSGIGSGPVDWNQGQGAKGNDPQLSMLAMILRQIAQNTGSPAMGMGY
jgi:hypothetical protein